MKKSTIESMKSLIESNTSVQKYELGVVSSINTTATMYHLVNDNELVFFMEHQSPKYHGSMVLFDMTDEKFSEKLTTFTNKYELSLDGFIYSLTH